MSKLKLNSYYFRAYLSYTLHLKAKTTLKYCHKKQFYYRQTKYKLDYYIITLKTLYGNIFPCKISISTNSGIFFDKTVVYGFLVPIRY